MTTPSLHAAEGGDRPAAVGLFTTLYEELHRLASRQLSRSPALAALNTTTLLHEAYLSMEGREGVSFPDRGHFMAYAARVMRGLIIDHDRERRAQKRGGGFDLTALTGDVADPAGDDGALARVGAALDELEGLDPALARVVDLKFFCGFSFIEIAAMSGVCERTVQRHWEKARICLRGLLRDANALS